MIIMHIHLFIPSCQNEVNTNFKYKYSSDFLVLRSDVTKSHNNSVHQTSNS